MGSAERNAPGEDKAREGLVAGGVFHTKMPIRRLTTSLLAVAGVAFVLAGCGSSAPAPKHTATHKAAAVTKPHKHHKQATKRHVKHHAKHKAVHKKVTASAPVTTSAPPAAMTATQAAAPPPPPPTHTTTAAPPPPPPPTHTTTTAPPPPTTTTQPAGGGGGCIPQGKNAGDGDGDNQGGPSDGDGCL